MPRLYLAHEALHGRSGHTVGRLLLDRLYRTHVADTCPEIAVTPLGKPYFPHSPWHFSISHSKGHAFCVLADCPVGIDAEELTRKVPPYLAGKILSPAELAQYEAAPDRNRALLTFWVLKEATAKHSGEGIRVPVNTTAFSLSDPRVQEIDGCLTALVY